MDALPVTIISGYLGAGKTTLVNRMLRKAGGIRIAILVNEFGELPVDEDLIEARDDDMISIAGGCICCSFGSDLAAALGRLSQLVPRPDHIVIEASGVAMPGSVATTVLMDDRLRVDGICVLADGQNIRRLLGDEYIGDTIERQLEGADLIILNKCDLVAATECDEVEAWLRGTWPGARILRASQGDVPNSILLGQSSFGATRQPHPHADGQYRSVLIPFEVPIDVTRLTKRLTDHALGVIRAKGFVTDLSGRKVLLQIVGDRADVTFSDDQSVSSGVVCIGLRERLDIEALQRIGETLQ